MNKESVTKMANGWINDDITDEQKAKAEKELADVQAQSDTYAAGVKAQAADGEDMDQDRLVKELEGALGMSIDMDALTQMAASFSTTVVGMIAAMRETTDIPQPLVVVALVEALGAVVAATLPENTPEALDAVRTQFNRTINGVYKSPDLIEKTMYLSARPDAIIGFGKLWAEYLAQLDRVTDGSVDFLSKLSDTALAKKKD